MSAEEYIAANPGKTTEQLVKGYGTLRFKDGFITAAVSIGKMLNIKQPKIDALVRTLVTL
jgi:hypothetical protein